MEDKIKITKDFRFGYQDLMKVVDVSQEFTLRDIFTFCENTLIPQNILEYILQCSYLKDYYQEINSRPFNPIKKMDYLEIYWWGSKQTYEGKREDGNMWSFHGIGKKGYVPRDVLEYGNLSEKEKEEYRQAMAIEFTPMYKLADFPIQISKKLHVTDYDIDVKVKDLDSDIDFQPSITLIELLHAIFWELSYCGSPKQRDEKVCDLRKSVKEFKSELRKKVKKTLKKNNKKILREQNNGL